MVYVKLFVIQNSIQTTYKHNFKFQFKLQTPLFPLNIIIANGTIMNYKIIYFDTDSILNYKFYPNSQCNGALWSSKLVQLTINIAKKLLL